MIHYLKPFTACHHLSCGLELSGARGEAVTLCPGACWCWRRFHPLLLPAVNRLCRRWRISQPRSLCYINSTSNTDVPIKRRLLRLWGMERLDEDTLLQPVSPQLDDLELEIRDKDK
ncbi:uncharacterized protein ndp isoform X2 [Notolabrus celidotus]|uniref:uncharacterized protein ndp isoform X2 n=1 Tax=Notolabrus celidotus TaxID=1203425 RepID=UPI00149070E3|nr:uncharacterized protein ndp isoform X2 [Notolabrus celidotus]